MSTTAAAVSKSPSPSSFSKNAASTAMSAVGSQPSPAPGSIHSGLSKHTTLPPISPPSHPHPSTGPSHVHGGGEGEGGGRNPFVLPPESELFTLRERERQRMRDERAQERKLKVHEKSTYSSRLNAKTASLRKQVLTSPHSGHPAEAEEKADVHEDTQFVLATTRDRHMEKEDLASYVSRKREMFLVQYSLGVKREEIRKLEEIAMAEERKLEAAEKYLEESATMFDEFLKENDKNAVEAIKMAEAATKTKLEKVAEIKRINAHLVAVKNEISRNNEQLLELRTYKEFLDSLAPPEWREQREVSRQARKSKKKPRPAQLQQDAASTDKLSSGSVTFLHDKPERRSNGSQAAEGGGASGGVKDDLSSDEEDTELYFRDPQQLVGIFTELEEQNLSLITNSQETEEALEEMRQNRLATEQKLNRKTESLKRQIDQLQATIAREEEKAYDLEIKSKMFSYGEYNAEDQEHMLAALDKKVGDVYSRCIGVNEANIPTLQMLAAIEGKMEELFETIETLPADKIDAAEKSKDKERRMKMREQKLEQQRQHQEERLRRALERAQAAPTKRMGRKLVYRSDPPVLKRKHKESKEKRDKEEEELQYFFS